ncbi:hypothetical protein HZB60_00280 [candidate division KSB1 bacterium]|nr:hypothetical protein [candidate division KSB1 bacterium]
MKPFRPRALLWTAALTYTLSYLYLAIYHGRIWLGFTVVHEGGTLTFLQSVFYASHFLGHIPSLTVIAFLFTGALRCWSPAPSEAVVATPRRYAWLTVSWVIACLLLSFVLFGRDDTLSYLVQLRQGVHRIEAGGSWLLHTPSTLLLFPFCLLYLFATEWLLTAAVPRLTLRGGSLYIAAALLFLIISAIVVPRPVSTLYSVWSDPRYLAHSVRELATFPLTFFPLPLYFLHRRREPGNTTSVRDSRRWKLLALCLALFGVGLVYQVQHSLSAGVSEIAQHPAFAGSAGLSIPYLLASHYFEHVLDTVYFTLVSLWIYSASMVRR